MNPVHLHLALNHVPVLGVLFGCATLVFGLMTRQPLAVRLSLATFVLSALSALPVFFSGESAEHLVEHLAGVSENLIDSHADIAKVALISIEILGFVSAVSLIKWRRALAVPGGVDGAILFLATLTAVVLVWTAMLGGRIRHEEIRPGTSISLPATRGELPNSIEKDE